MNQYHLTPQAGHNFTPDLVEMLRVIPDGETVIFDKGTYDFYADGCDVEYMCPVCNKSSDKRIVFPVFHKKNITVDGGNSDFVFHDRVTPFVAQKTDGITFRNFTVDFSFPRYLAAEATAYEEGLLLAFNKKEAGASVNNDRNLTIEAGDTLFSTGEKVFFLQQGTTVCYLAAGKAEYSVAGLPARVFYCDAEDREDGIFLRYRPDSIRPFTNGQIVVSYDEARDNDCFFFDRCSNVKVDNVSIYRTAGMGIVTQLCHNVELTGIRYQAGKNGDEVYSTTADGLFFTQDTGLVHIHDCQITKTMDDAVSIHNIYAVCDKILTPNRILVRYKHPSHSGFNPFYSGDKVIVSDRDSKNETGSLIVRSSHMENDTYAVFIEFEEDVTGKIKPGDYLENHERSPEVIIENCLFEAFPHIRLASRKAILFKNNTVRNGDGVIVNDLMTYWYAYGKSEDVTVVGNRFEQCSVGFEALVDRAVPECNVKHGTVKVVSNKFIDCETAVHLADVEHPSIEDNAYCSCGETERVSRR